ncbi:hypothetical protein EXS70_05235, partial [Candidatus Peribacteria bacterium]|nr:hypothetical protein [Candidatus Peribacteria bacterium]
MSFFSEHRLIFITKAALDVQRNAAGASASLTKSQNRVAIKTEVARRDTINQNVRNQDRQVSSMNAAARDLKRDVTFSREGVVGSRGTEIYGKTGGKTFATGLTQNVTAEQKRTAVRSKAEGELITRLSSEENAARKSGNYDPFYFDQKRSNALSELNATFLGKDTRNASFQQQRATARAGVKGIEKPITTTGGVNQKSLPNLSIQGRSQERGQLRSQRLGLEGKQKGQQDQNGSGASSGATVSQEEDIPTETFGTHTKKQREAAGALQGDGLEAPGSLSGLVDEEMNAAQPVLDAQAAIRDSFKIYKSGAQKLLDERGKQIEDYKTEGIDRAEQIADMKIEQSKSNRDLELELIGDARERSRRDELLTQEKTETDYEREEDRIVAEN